MLGSAIFLVTAQDGRWHPGIGDPTAVGWLTVVAYFYAAYWAHRARSAELAWLAPHDAVAAAGTLASRKLATFWLLAFVLLVALGINKQLDLQSWLTEFARDLAHAQGWYAERRRVQLLFIAGVALTGLGIAALLIHYFRSVLRRVLLGLVGIVLLFTFVVIRAASFHHVDAFLGAGNIKMNWILELGAIAAIAVAARRAAKSAPVERRRGIAARA